MTRGKLPIKRPGKANPLSLTYLAGIDMCLLCTGAPNAGMHTAALEPAIL